MRKILIGYEYGLGMGHLARMLPIAHALSSRSCNVVFFLRNPRECAKIFTKEKLPIIPVMDMMAYIPEMGKQPRFHSYSDFIAFVGCYYPENILTVTFSWKTIFDLYEPT